MNGKPEGQESAVTVGSNTRVTFVGVALLGLLAGICTTTAAVAVGLERLNRNMEDRPTRTDIYYWSQEAQRTVPGLPLFPPTKKD